jgi:glycosyltransferase involved in cell wall biosynthesis
VKICLLLSTFAYDGIKRSVVHYANAMHDLGHETWVGVLHDWPGKLSLRDELAIPAARVVSWEGLGQGRRELAMWRFFRRERFDVVHANTLKMNHVGRWVALAAGVPAVFASEDNLCLGRSRLTRMEDRFLAARSSGVVAISEAVRRSFLEAERLPASKLHVVYYGLPLERFAAARRDPAFLDAFRERLAIPRGPTVAVAARLDPMKSLDTLVEAAARVRAKVADAQFVLAGDGPEMANLRALSAARGLSGAFHFLGGRSDVYDVLQLGDVVALCSAWEGIGLSLVEGMALGRPLVGTDVAGIHEVIEEGRNGLLVPPKDPASLASALARLLGDGPLRTRLAAEGARVVAAKFDVRANARRLLALYEAATAARR